MYYVEVEPGVRLFVRDINPTAQHTVVFIHGWPVDHRMFEYQWNQLPGLGFRCIGIDLRGFGKSDAPWHGYDYSRLADDILAVVKAIGLRHFILVGFSVGGAIVTRYMARHRGYGVTKLALMSAAAPSFVQRPGFPHGLTVQEVNKMIEETYADRPKMLGEFAKNFFASRISPEFAVWFNGLALEASGHGTIAVLESLRDEDLSHDLTQIQVPTAIFHGALDQVCPFALAQAQHKAIAHSKLHRFEKSGHGVFYDELDLFNDRFFHFLRHGG